MRIPKCDLSPRVKTRVEYDLEDFQEDIRQLQLFKNEYIQQITPNYGGIGGGSSVSTPTENSVVRMCSSAYVRHTEVKVEAIERVIKTLDASTLRLIELVYWRKTHNVEGAGMVVGLSKSGAYKRLNKVLTAIASSLGYIET